MDPNNLAPMENSSKDNSTTQKPRVIELAQQHSGKLSDVTVAGAEAYVKNNHKDNTSEGGDVSGCSNDDIPSINLNPNEFSAESNTNMESSMGLIAIFK